MDNSRPELDVLTDGSAGTQQELMECVERLIQSCAVPTFVIDSGHRVILWNRACEALTGVDASQVIGTCDLGKVFYGCDRSTLADFVLNGDLKGVEEYYEAHSCSLLIPDGLQAERWYSDSMGRLRYIVFDAAPIRNGHGETIAVIETIQDITLRKLAEEKLQGTASHLAEMNEEIRSFAHIVSHDLRAPLVNLKGFSGELGMALKELAPVFERGLAAMKVEERGRMEELFHRELPEALGFIDSSADRMERLIDGVLKVSRLEGKEIRPESVDVVPLIESILRSLTHQLDERNATVEIGDLPQVTADRTGMEQILGNLLDNAVKYLVPGRPGRISISAERSRDATTFHVADNGRGIAAADQGKIFDIFRRSGRRDVPGEGVGLAYVRTLVRRMGGRIWCRSKQDEGSTFSFTIPKMASAAANRGGRGSGR